MSTSGWHPGSDHIKQSASTTPTKQASAASTQPNTKLHTLTTVPTAGKSSQTIPPPTPLTTIITDNGEKEKQHRQQCYQQALEKHIQAQIGDPPSKPSKIALNPFLTFQKDYWIRAKQQCESNKRQATNNPEAKAARDEIRAVLGQMWREAEEEVKKPYHDLMAVNRRTNDETIRTWGKAMTEYERKKEEVVQELTFEKWANMNPAQVAEN